MFVELYKNDEGELSDTSPTNLKNSAVFLFQEERLS